MERGYEARCPIDIKIHVLKQLLTIISSLRHTCLYLLCVCVSIRQVVLVCDIKCYGECNIEMQPQLILVLPSGVINYAVQYRLVVQSELQYRGKLPARGAQRQGLKRCCLSNDLVDRFSQLISNIYIHIRHLILCNPWEL